MMSKLFLIALIASLGHIAVKEHLEKKRLTRELFRAKITLVAAVMQQSFVAQEQEHLEQEIRDLAATTNDMQEVVHRLKSRSFMNHLTGMFG
jgi:HPt (histidine-containing phosphotransfer) domain-containing protein